jgi:hypothetical protein
MKAQRRLKSAEIPRLFLKGKFGAACLIPAVPTQKPKSHYSSRLMIPFSTHVGALSTDSCHITLLMAARNHQAFQ